MIKDELVIVETTSVRQFVSMSCADFTQFSFPLKMNFNLENNRSEILKRYKDVEQFNWNDTTITIRCYHKHDSQQFDYV